MPPRRVALIGMLQNRQYRSLALCYHAVSETWANSLAVTPRSLERQLRSLLLRRFRPAGAMEVAGGGKRLFHVTFDDAFRNVSMALPVLERLAVPTTVFACTGYASDGRALDVPEVSTLARDFRAEMATMDWDMLADLADRKIEIGSHTVTHPHLPELSDAEIQRELTDSREEIETRLRRPCRLLAYPYGDDDPRVHRVARRAGYAAAFSLSSNEKPFDIYALPRVELYRHDDLLRATLKMSAARRPARALIQALAR